MKKFYLRDVRKLARIICFVFFLAHRVNSGPFDFDNQVHPSYEPEYLENFLAPDSEFFRNISFCPRAWHVKEMPAVLQLWDLPGEEHNITTEDGYVITLFRLTPQKPNSTPVLMLHGLLASPELFLMRGEEDLPILLREAGFDVWLGSYRGSYYGRNHINLTTEDEQFWDFSFHEHGLFDVPGMVDYILLHTGLPSVAAIGHSMGNAAFFTMLSLRPEYNEKVHMYVGLAPYAVAKMGKAKLRRSLLPTVLLLMKANKNWKSNDILRRRKINPFVGLCWSLPRVCFTAVEMTLGTSVADFDWKLLPVLGAYFPSGSSNKNLEHMFQLFDGDFVLYDYGPVGNMEKYNRKTPPSYDLSNMRVPVSLYYGETDLLVTVAGMKAQVQALPNVVKSIVVPGYNHFDFLVGRNTRDALYNPIIEDLKQYDLNLEMSSSVEDEMQDFTKMSEEL